MAQIGTGGSDVMKKFNQLNQEYCMEKAIEDKLNQEHEKRVQENQEALENYHNLVNEKDQDAEPEQKDDFDEDDDMDEDEKEIMRQMAEKRHTGARENYENMKNKNKRDEIGEYRLVDEEDFFNVVTKNENAVCQFFHSDFNRCRIAEHHLRQVAYHHPECKFLQVDVQKAPFLTAKLCIQVLPTITMFKNGIKCDEMVGFEDVGGNDNFATGALARRLAIGKVIKLKDDEKFKLTQKKKAAVGGESESDSDED